MYILWGENPKLPSNSPKCSKHAFMAHVSSGRNVGQILSSVAPNLESQGQSSLDLRMVGQKEGMLGMVCVC